MDYFALFLEGLLSFFSPCVLPLLPAYVSYLSADSKDGNKKRPVINSLYFALGISTTFVLLAFSASLISDIVNDYKLFISLLGGVIIVLFGLKECNIISFPILEKEYSLKDKINLKGLNRFKAFIFGFLFSCAWSPCIGPLLASALLAATLSQHASLSVLIYASGFVIPFLITGFFSAAVLNWLKGKKKYFKYLTTLAGIVLLAYGSMMIYDAGKDICKLQERVNSNKTYVTNDNLLDQDGNLLNLSDYEDQYIFLNFTATWCTYCQEEIPDYLNFAADNPDVVCFYVMSESINGAGQPSAKEYREDNDINIPIIVDEDLFNTLGISSYPTLFVIGPDGSYLVYQTGMLSMDYFEQVLAYAQEVYEKE